MGLFRHLPIMKILLIEDEPKTAASIQAFLEESGLAVSHAPDGQAGHELALREPFDVIVSDIQMPRMTGLELCQKLREAGIQTPFLFLSALSQTDDKVTGLNVGADDYLAKPFDFSELKARIEALARRRSTGGGQAAAVSRKLVFADLEMNLDTLEVVRAGQKIVLTPREFALLEFFVRNPGRVVSKTEILERVWNIDEKINTNVIEVYVSYVRNKVDKGFDQKILHTHFGVGYVLKLPA